MRQVAGLPLFVHSVKVAQESSLFDAIVVSSDAQEALALAHQFGVTHTVLRPEELASDTSGKVEAIVHAVRAVEAVETYVFDTVVDLDATSPLRTLDDLYGAVDLLEKSGAQSVITACEARHSPYFNLVEIDSVTGQVRVAKQLPGSVLRRQDAPLTFDMNASIYAWNRDALMKEQTVFFQSTRIYVMPAERSIDIDSEFDFEIVRWLMEKDETEHGKV